MAQQRVNIKDSALGQLLSKMIDDKKAISEYIRKNGTLEGFVADGIKFAQPLWLWGLCEWIFVQDYVGEYLYYFFHRIQSYTTSG